MAATPVDVSEQDGRAAPRFHAVDALRGIAALSVLFFHLYRSSAQSEVLQAAFPEPLKVALDYSRSGVAIFFVISGFVIGHTTRNLPPRMREGLAFSLRRQVRLDPPYYVVMLGVLLLTIVERQIPGLEYRYIGLKQFLVNMFYLQDFTGTEGVLAVAWTLCLEVQFYLVVVLLVLLAGRVTPDQASRKRLVVVAALTLGAVSLAVPLLGVQTGPWFIGTWWMFCLGLSISWFLHGHIRGWTMIAILSILGMWFAVTPIVHGNYPWGGPWFAWATGVLIAALVVTGRLSGPVPRPLLYFGTLSYSLYLVHLPVIDTLLGALFKLTSNSVAGALLAYLAGAGASIAVAHVLQRVVERRSIRWSKRIGTTSSDTVPATLAERRTAA